MATTTLFADSSTDTPSEAKMRKMGLVDISEVDPSIGVHLVYSTPNNFVGSVLYEDVHKAFMLDAVAMKLVKAQKMLKQLRPDLSLLIYDAARPIQIQRVMWEIVKNTPNQIYVANPANGRGMHNFGAAVDVTLMDSNGNPLPMGSPFDFFGDAAKVSKEVSLLKSGKITKEEYDNRRLLRKVMTSCGFIIYINEWWHFNHISPRLAKGKFKLIE